MSGRTEGGSYRQVLTIRPMTLWPKTPFLGSSATFTARVEPIAKSQSRVLWKAGKASLCLLAVKQNRSAFVLFLDARTRKEQNKNITEKENADDRNSSRCCRFRLHHDLCCQHQRFDDGNVMPAGRPAHRLPTTLHSFRSRRHRFGWTSLPRCRTMCLQTRKKAAAWQR